MARTTLSNSAGPGSSTPLAPETIKVRDAVIAKCNDQSLDEMNEFVKGLLDRETDELKRLGILAARVYILRQRIMALMESGALNGNDKYLGFIDPSPAQADDNIDSSSDLNIDDEDTNWMRVKIIENCEVNGVRFPSGVIIDVQADDANKLIESGKAELQAKNLNNDFADIPDDTSDMSDETTEAPDDQTDTSVDLADASEEVNDFSSDITDTDDGLADKLAENIDDTLSDLPDENVIEEDEEANESSTDMDDQSDDDTDIQRTNISDDNIMPDQMPDEVDLTAPLSDDASKSEEDAVTDTEDTADNEAIAAAVADKMPKASASSPDGEPVETTESDLLDGLEELADLEDVETESDDNKK